MRIRSVLNSIRRTARNHGGLPALCDVVRRGLNRYVYCKTLQCVVTDKVKEEYLSLPSDLRFTRLEYRALMELAKTREYELWPEFLSSALGKGDECYAILNGNVLASYGWYSQKPTLMDNNDLLFHFDPRYVYMYKGFTLDRYRGRRLHAIGKTRALAEYLSRGVKGMLAYVESNNFSSLKSSYRMGGRSCGRFRVLRIAGKYLVRTQPECERYGLALHRNLSGSSSIARALINPGKRSGFNSWLPLSSRRLSIE